MIACLFKSVFTKEVYFFNTRRVYNEKSRLLTEVIILASNINRTLAKERSDLMQKRLTYTDHPDRKITAQLSTPRLLKTDKIVLNALKYFHSATRSDLVKSCQLPTTTIYDALIRLQRIGAVERYFEDRKTRGRPKTFYRIL